MRQRLIYVVVIMALTVLWLTSCDLESDNNEPEFEMKRHVLTLKDFWDDSSLKADPRNLIAAAFRSAPTWVTLPQSCAGDCLAVIPYHIDRYCSLGLYWSNQDTAGTYAVLTDDQGNELATVVPGAREVRVDLAPDDYFIHLYRTASGDTSAVYIQPDPDIDQPLYYPEILAYPDRLLFYSRDCIGCNLSGGNLLQALMSNCCLDEANLSGTNLLGAQLENSSLADAKLDGANMFQTRLSQSSLKGASLAGAMVFQSDFTEADLSGANMQGINAAEACFTRAYLRGVNASGAILGYINGTEADFSEAQLRGTILIYADLTNTVFTNADLRETNLFGAVVDGADFTGADMTGAIWVNGSYCESSSVDSCRD